MVAYTIIKLLDLPFYTEGPAADAAGNFFFTTLSGGTVGRLNRAGTHTLWAEAACPNGQLILPDGGHLVCETGTAAISRFSPDGERLGSLLAGSCAGIPFDTPNDLIVDAAQHLYFTDSIRGNGKVFCRLRNGRELVVAADIDYANGLVLSADERYLYVAESYSNRILRIELMEPGIARRAPEVFATLPFNAAGYNLPDGLAIDNKGHLWVAHYGMAAIQVLSETGMLLYTIDTGMPLVSNLCFVEDSAHRQVLLVTGGYGEPGPGALLQITVNTLTEG